MSRRDRVRAARAERGGQDDAVRILTTLLPPTRAAHGSAGVDVVTRAGRLRQRIGLAGQYAAVDENLTGFENLQMVGRLYHVGRRPARERARELLEDFDLADAGGRLVRTYSGGMRRRLDLAAALVARPPVVFLDEPTTGLDPRSRIALWDTIEGLVVGGTTVLLTTQYLDEADRLAERIAVIDGGTVIAEGTPERAEGRRRRRAPRGQARRRRARRETRDRARSDRSQRAAVVRRLDRSGAVAERSGAVAEAVRLTRRGRNRRRRHARPAGRPSTTSSSR